jgi:hypothetical protein
MTILVTVLLVLIALTTSAAAYTCNASGCTWRSSYTEPSMLTNGQPLTDLMSCTLTYTTSIDAAPDLAAKTFVVPASKPQGGGAISQDFTDPTMLPSHTYRITETAACTNGAATGPAGAPAVLLMNNGVAPQPPGPLQLQ